MAKKKIVVSKHGDHIVVKEGKKSTDVGQILSYLNGMYTAKIKGDFNGSEYYEISNEPISKYCIKVHYHFVGDNWVEISARTHKELKKIVSDKYGWTTEVA